MSTTTLADIERLVWHLSGWTVEQRAADELLAAIRAHMDCGCPGAGEAGSEPVTPPVRAVETPEASQADPGQGETLTGAQAGAQRVHITGTLTLVCSGSRPAPVDAAEHPRTVPDAVPTGTASLAALMRQCTKCGERKPVGQFNRRSSDAPALRSHCRACEAARKRKAA